MAHGLGGQAKDGREGQGLNNGKGLVGNGLRRAPPRTAFLNNSLGHDFMDEGTIVHIDLVEWEMCGAARSPVEVTGVNWTL